MVKIPLLSRTKILLIILLFLTAGILFYPLHLTLFYNPVSSPFIFENIPLFAILYTSWFALLLVLLIISKKATCQVFLLGIFSLVFLSLWVIITPFGQTADSVYQMGHVQYILDVGRINPTSQILGYFQAPGLPILAASLSLITGLNVFLTSTSYLIFTAIFFTFTLFVAYNKILGNGLTASLAVLIIIHGDIFISLGQDYHPMNLSLLFVSSLIILFFSKDFSRRNQIMFLIIYSGLVTAYVSLAFGVLFLLIGYFLIGVIKRNTILKRTRTEVNLLFASLIIFLSWEIFVAVQLFSATAILIPDILNQTLEDRLVWFLNVSQANTGAQVPFWANSIRLFWIAFIFGLGFILVLNHLRNFKKLNWVLTSLLASLGGFVAFGLIAMLISPGGDQYHRLLLYVPFFAVPLIAMSLNKRKIFVYLLVGILISLSFGTFLANNSRISYSTIYADEISSGNFLTKSFGTGDQLQIYTSIWAGSFSYVNLYNAYRLNEGDPAYLGVTQYWTKINSLLDVFQDPSTHIDQKIFIFSNKFGMAAEHLLGITPDNPQMHDYLSRLSLNNRVYSNGNVVLYSPT